MFWSATRNSVLFARYCTNRQVWHAYSTLRVVLLLKAHISCRSPFHPCFPRRQAEEGGRVTLRGRVVGHFLSTLWWFRQDLTEAADVGVLHCHLLARKRCYETAKRCRVTMSKKRPSALGPATVEQKCVTGRRHFDKTRHVLHVAAYAISESTKISTRSIFQQYKNSEKRSNICTLQLGLVREESTSYGVFLLHSTR